MTDEERKVWDTIVRTTKADAKIDFVIGAAAAIHAVDAELKRLQEADENHRKVLIGMTTEVDRLRTVLVKVRCMIEGWGVV